MEDSPTEAGDEDERSELLHTVRAGAFHSGYSALLVV